MSFCAKCPGCGQTIEWHDNCAGTIGHCSFCGNQFELSAFAIPTKPEQSTPPQSQPHQHRVVLDHGFQAEGAFKTGSGWTLGALVAGVVVFVGMSIMAAIYLAVKDAGRQAANESRRSTATAPLSQSRPPEMETAPQTTTPSSWPKRPGLPPRSDIPPLPEISYTSFETNGFRFDDVTSRAAYPGVTLIGDVTNRSGTGYLIVKSGITARQKWKVIKHPRSCLEQLFERRAKRLYTNGFQYTFRSS
jgi:hypothetical protein